jgi:hypothetical protein
MNTTWKWPNLGRETLGNIVKHMPKPLRGSLGGTRLGDKVDRRGHVYLCQLCNMKRWNRWKENYRAVYYAPGVPQMSITSCTACNEQGVMCFTYTPEELGPKVWDDKIWKHSK